MIRKVFTAAEIDRVMRAQWVLTWKSTNKAKARLGLLEDLTENAHVQRTTQKKPCVQLANVLHNATYCESGRPPRRTEELSSIASVLGNTATESCGKQKSVSSWIYARVCKRASPDAPRFAPLSLQCPNLPASPPTTSVHRPVISLQPTHPPIDDFLLFH